jgi:hypothetical protein
MLNPLPINAQIERAAQIVVRARIFYDIWLYFEGTDTRPTIIDTMQRFSEFFRFDPHAHFVAFVIHIAALFENRKDTINLPRLVKDTIIAAPISTQIATKTKTLLSQAKPLASKAAILRSNLFAHRSATLTYSEAFKKAAVTANQLRDLTEIALAIANHLLRARGLSDQFFNPLPRDHADAMLKTLAERA